VLSVIGYFVGTVASDLELSFHADFPLQAWVNTLDAIGWRAEEDIFWKAQDKSFIFEGTRWPVILRPQKEGSFIYKHIGPIYLRGALCAYGHSDDVEDYLSARTTSRISLI
jgi:hypothetical protein